jgi:hypothetical protein
LAQKIAKTWFLALGRRARFLIDNASWQDPFINQRVPADRKRNSLIPLPPFVIV